MQVPWLPMPMLTVLPAAAPELGPGTGNTPVVPGARRSLGNSLSSYLVPLRKLKEPVRPNITQGRPPWFQLSTVSHLGSCYETPLTPGNRHGCGMRKAAAAGWICAGGLGSSGQWET